MVLTKHSAASSWSVKYVRILNVEMVQWLGHCATNRKVAGSIPDGVTGGTALQTGRSRDQFPTVLLEFFIDIKLSAALWPWG
jgi:hypothetical protein